MTWIDPGRGGVRQRLDLSVIPWPYVVEVPELDVRRLAKRAFLDTGRDEEIIKAMARAVGFIRFWNKEQDVALREEEKRQLKLEYDLLETARIALVNMQPRGPLRDLINELCERGYLKRDLLLVGELVEAAVGVRGKWSSLDKRSYGRTPGSFDKAHIRQGIDAYTATLNTLVLRRPGALLMPPSPNLKWADMDEATGRDVENKWSRAVALPHGSRGKDTKPQALIYRWVALAVFGDEQAKHDAINKVLRERSPLPAFPLVWE